MSEWKETKLQEIAVINPTERLAKGIKAKKVAMELLQPFTKKISTYTREEYKGGVKFRNGDTLVARITPSLENGKTSFVDLLEDDEIGFGSTEFIVLREIEGISDKNFLFYLACSPEFRDLAIASMTGTSGRQRVQTDVVKQHEFLFPPLSEQRAIASVLSSLDDKIDLLHRQNKTLEAMAETLFRQWFVEGADEGWEVVKLRKYVKCTTGYSYKSADLNPSTNALVTLKNFARDGSFRMDGFKEYTGKYKDTQIVKQGDLVVSHTDITQEADIIGNPALVIDTGQFETLIITTDLMKVESNVDWLGKEFLYYLFKSPDFKFYCLGCSNGTTVLHMSRNAIPGYEFKIPNKNRVKIFTATVVPILEKIFKNAFQIRTLEKLRDTLLPKLMSGEVRVKSEQ
ncbi:MAG: restriction endonuclease subunit S [Methanosarcinaceae archaeon]